jgi:hypothetical protein
MLNNSRQLLSLLSLLCRLRAACVSAYKLHKLQRNVTKTFVTALSRLLLTHQNTKIASKRVQPDENCFLKHVRKKCVIFTKTNQLKPIVQQGSHKWTTHLASFDLQEKKTPTWRCRCAESAWRHTMKNNGSKIEIILMLELEKTDQMPPQLVLA